MRIRVAVIVGMVLLVTVTGWTQSRLGEVAGSIKLNPEAVVEKEGWVDDTQALLQADRELLEMMLTDCSAAADVLAALLREFKITYPNFDDTVQDRISAATVDLDDQLLRLEHLRLADAFADPMSTALDAAEQCAVTNEAVRERLNPRGMFSFTASEEAVDQCVQELGRARTILDAIENDPASATGKAPGGAMTDEEIIEAACKSERDREFEAGEACADRQYRALASLTARNAENERMEPGVFVGIRRICAELQPGDFIARDLCEVEKLTAVRLDEQ